MTLRLFDTAANSLRDFVPLTPGQVGIYLCGATVQGAPHVGHLRPAVAFDILRRWLMRSGNEVTFIRNVTDIDDKILAKAAEAGQPWWAWAGSFERAFTQVYDAIGSLPPTYEPRATGHVTDMIALMQLLLDRGHAYVGNPGNVYFDVRSYPEYGSLTHQRLEDMEDADDADAAGDKRHPQDFAMWKAPRPGEPDTAAWPTPWGQGRPGWHLECSAMARRYLGESFDIHAGGLDLRFPHHENEQAQSRAAGFGFAHYWLHNGWVTQQGTKMSKSLGNSLMASEILAKARPVVLRYALSAGHYRSMIEYSDDTLREAGAAWERIEGFVHRAVDRVADGAREVDTIALPAGFVEALDDDLNVPEALAVIHEHVTAGNTALADLDDEATEQSVLSVRAMLDVLGLDPLDPHWAAGATDQASHAALDALVQAELAERAKARLARDFATADAIRDRLAAAGIAVEDGPAGARWTLA